MKKRKKRIRINYGNLFILLIFIFGLIYCGNYIFNKLYKDDNNIDNKNEVTTKLESLGYSSNEIEIISKNLSKENILTLNKKYENLAEYSKVKYFHIENIERYDKLNASTNYPTEEIIMRVNTDIDQDYYTDIEIVDNPDDVLVLVNKYHALPSGIEPTDLVDIEGEQMQRVAAEALKELVKDMRSDGLEINLLSGYRSEDTQRNLYNRYVASDGQEDADTYSARPNHSEHQLGLAIDVSNNWSLSEAFENTEQFDWLDKNAHKYGFIMRYPKDKIYMTGYDYEPWHYRYVGIEVATLIKNENITFEEYHVKYKGLY